MTTRIRLRRMGSNKRPFYRVVVADQRSPRDGRFIEIIRRYHPLNDPSVKELVEFLCRELVDDADAVRVHEAFDERGPVYTVTVAPGELGKVIGRGGRTAKAIRTVVRAAATRQHVSVRVDFED